MAHIFRFPQNSGLGLLVDRLSTAGETPPILAPRLALPVMDEPLPAPTPIPAPAPTPAPLPATTSTYPTRPLPYVTTPILAPRPLPVTIREPLINTMTSSPISVNVTPVSNPKGAATPAARPLSTLVLDGSTFSFHTEDELYHKLMAITDNAKLNRMLADAQWKNLHGDLIRLLSERVQATRSAGAAPTPINTIPAVSVAVTNTPGVAQPAPKSKAALIAGGFAAVGLLGAILFKRR